MHPNPLTPGVQTSAEGLKVWPFSSIHKLHQREKLLVGLTWSLSARVSALSFLYQMPLAF